MKFNLRRTMMLAGGSLAIAGLMAAYSYTSATVANAASLSVVDTNAALLALIPGSPNGVGSTPDLDTPVVDAAGNLVFDFNHGLNGGDFGLQGNSSYTWMDMFTVQNNSNNAVTVTIAAANVPAGVTLSLQSGQFGYGSNNVNTNSEGGGYTSITGGGTDTYTLQPGEWVEFDAQANVAAGTALGASSNMQINVSGQATSLESE